MNEYQYTPSGWEAVPQSLAVTPQQTVENTVEYPVQFQVINVASFPSPL